MTKKNIVLLAEGHSGETVQIDTAASESELNDLLATASKHYAEMPPHVRSRKTANLLYLLIEQNSALQEALVYVAHAGHRTPWHMLPPRVKLSGGNAVEVELSNGVTVAAKYGS